MQNGNLNKDLTILVCSCDAYEDLWTPFFTLLKKHWTSLDLPIVLNTESKNFKLDGLDIKCIHSPFEKRYGQRMINALSTIKTEYVLLLLDDFFLRKPVSEERINQIINWMKDDQHIAYFNCDCLPTYIDYEMDKFPGFKRLPPACDYTLNMQAAIWRTKILKEFWRPSASPWEWETIYNLLILNYPKYKFYCANQLKNSFLDYGHCAYGDIWGVYRGKWVIEDVEPLFEREGIKIDYLARGVCKEVRNVEKSEKVSERDNSIIVYPIINSSSGNGLNNSTIKSFSDVLARLKKFCEIRSFLELPLYISYEIYRIMKAVFTKKELSDNYFTYLLEKERKRFLSSINKSQIGT